MFCDVPQEFAVKDIAQFFSEEVKNLMEEKQVHKGRIILLISLIVIVFVAFALKLMQYQIVNAEEYKEMAQGNYTSVQSIDAARGEILDRYGRPLAVNQVSYDIMINEAYLPADMKNTVIERIILLMEQEGQTGLIPCD